MYAHQRLLRIKNFIDTCTVENCSKCGTTIQGYQFRNGIHYSTNDYTAIKDYYKKINFMSAKVWLDFECIARVNILDNKEEVLHCEFFKDDKFLTDDNLYLLPFFKLLHTYTKNNFPVNVRKSLIESYNQFLIKATRSISDSKNAVIGKYISNSSLNEKLSKIIANDVFTINEEIKDFVSEEFYQKYKGKKIHIVVNETSSDVFLEPYTARDIDNYIAWVIIDNFSKWYKNNIVNYKVLCPLCLAKGERRKADRYPSVLKNSFENAEMEDLKKAWTERRIKFQNERRAKQKQDAIEHLKIDRPGIYKKIVGEEVTETTIENGKKTTKTSIKKS